MQKRKEKEQFSVWNIQISIRHFLWNTEVAGVDWELPSLGQCNLIIKLYVLHKQTPVIWGILGKVTKFHSNKTEVELRKWTEDTGKGIRKVVLEAAF